MTRGNKDLRADEDFEDIIFLFNNRNKLMEEIRETSEGLRAFLADSFLIIMQNLTFKEGIYSVLPVDTAITRTPVIVAMFEEISSTGRKD